MNFQCSMCGEKFWMDEDVALKVCWCPFCGNELSEEDE